MANSFVINQAAPTAGLGTFSYTITASDAGEMTAAIQSTLPIGSGLQIVINQNSTPLVTVGGAATNPTPTQPSIGTSARLNAASGDVISFVLTSSNNVDSEPNAVKSIINLYQGE